MAQTPQINSSTTSSGRKCIKYCYDKGKFYLLDEEGVEFEMAVLRKEALPPPAPPKVQ